VAVSFNLLGTLRKNDKKTSFFCNSFIIRLVVKACEMVHKRVSG